MARSGAQAIAEASFHLCYRFVARDGSYWGITYKDPPMWVALIWGTEIRVTATTRATAVNEAIAELQA
jgi:hypothetical protein